MLILNQIFKIFSFLSSFLGTIIIIGFFYFFLHEALTISTILGLLIVTLIILFTRTSFANIRKFKRLARKQGVAKKHRRAVSKAIRNRFFSGHIARAFMLGTVFILFEMFLSLLMITIFCALVILSMMRLRGASLFKIVMSVALGSISGVIGVILSNFFL